MTRPRSISTLSSRYASCTDGVLEACARAVATGADLDDVIPGMSAREVALIAQNALEAYQVATELADVRGTEEVIGSDWMLMVLAELAFEAARSITLCAPGSRVVPAPTR